MTAVVRSNMFIYAIVVLISSWGSILGVNNHNNHGASRAMECFDEMKKENNISYLLLNVRNPQQISRFCRKTIALMRCIADNEHYLTTKQNTELQRSTRGIHQFYLNVCPPGTDITEAYKANAACFELVRRQILYCQDEFVTMDDSYIQNGVTDCCSLNDYRSCMTRPTRIRCGVEASNVMNEMLKRYYHSQDNSCEYTREEDCHLTKDDKNKEAKNTGSKTTKKDWEEVPHSFSTTEPFKTNSALVPEYEQSLFLILGVNLLMILFRKFN